MSRVSSSKRADASTTRRGSSSFRPDIEGLRAVAVGVVLLYHAGLKLVPGGFVGVDVFFVISGFLITGLLIREFERTGRISFATFYSRRARRLLPASALVLVVSAILMWLTASPVDLKTIGADIVAAALYVVNWQLAARSVDYLAEGAAASPVQHYWSLSIEEQFYVLWPLVILLAVLIVRRFEWNVRAVMGAGLLLIVIPSFVWSVLSTASEPQAAYFLTTTRLWELGVGALVAVAAGTWANMTRSAARILGVVGIGAIIASALLFDSSTRWPGAWALAPVLGTAAVIAAGTTHHVGAARMLSLPAMVWVGGLSYSLYLWHWPLLIAVGNAFGTPNQEVGLLVVFAAFVPAWLSHRFIENPVRLSGRLSLSRGLTFSLGINLMAVGAVSGLLLMLAGSSAPIASASASAAAGGASLSYDDDSISGVELSGTVASMSPTAAMATEDLPASSNDGCHRDFETVIPEPCSIGADKGDTTIVIVGDSKIQQWSDALGEIARERGWRMLLATKSNCGFSDALRELSDGVPYLECRQYNEALMKQLLTLHPDAVVTSQRHNTAYIPGTTEYSQDEMRDALARTWATLESHGIDVIALLDNPSPSGVEAGDGEIYRCVTEVDDLAECSFDRQSGVKSSGAVAMTAAAQKVPSVDVVDLADALCDETTCPPVIGDMLVYRQGSHLTNTYVLSLEPILASRLDPLVEAAAR